MNCSQCGAQNRPERKFCRSCGATLAAACPRCGTANDADDRFCGQCGEALAGDPAATSDGAREPRPTPDAPTAERRLVSILFADLVGFTALSEDRDPEETRELLSRYFDAAREIIERYGGTVEKFIGDAVMAVWGAPIAHEDDAERAVRAALDLTADVPRRISSEEGVQLRAGVLSGEAAVTMRAAGQGMVAGDLVNTASRLQSAAQPGSVLVGESTFRAASRSIMFEPVGDQVLKGKALPMTAWRALRVIAGRGGSGRTEGLEAPFVGRSDELRMLKETLSATGREGRSRLVSLVGIAGIGKSRLVEELERYVDGIVETIYWHRGRSPAYGEGIAFWALAEMVRERAGVAESDEPAERRSKLTAMLSEWVTDEQERAWLEPHLAHLIGLEGAAAGDRDELFAAWRRLFERIAERGTTVLVFEDLHWADPGLIEFVEELSSSLRTRPLLVIALARPELLDRWGSWGAGHPSFTSLRLEPLADGAMRELLLGTVPGIPEDAVQQIVDRAEGIPLYAIEFVRMLVDRGALRYADGRFTLDGELHELAIPESLQAVVAARLDSLAAAERRLVQDAAVLGLSFSRAGLEAVTGLDRAEAESALRSLVRRDFFQLNEDPRSPERGQYAFVQSVIREVAYGTLSRTDRRDRHLAVARHFEQLEEGELSAVVASHYLDAYRLSPDHPPDLATAARTRLEEAAERAASLGSPGRALVYLDQAQEVAQDDADRNRLAERAGVFALDADRTPIAEERFRVAVDWYGRTGDAVGLARATSHLGTSLMLQSRVTEAIDLLSAALPEQVDLEQRPELIDVAAALARALMLADRIDDAYRVLERAAPAAEALGLVDLTLQLVITKGWTLATQGRVQEGSALLRGALSTARDRDLTTARQRAAMNFSGIYFVDDPVAAGAVAREVAEWGLQRGLLASRSLLGNACDVALLTGDWDWILDRYAALHDPRASPLSQGGIGSAAAIVIAMRGDPDRALEMTRSYAEVISHSSSNQDREMLASSRAAILLAAGDAPGALEAVRDMPSFASGATLYSTPARAALWAWDLDGMRGVVISEARRRGRYVDAVRLLREASLAALEDRRDQARTQFRDAAAALDDLALPVEAALARLDAIVALGADDEESAAWAEAARAVFTRLGAAPMLTRLEAALGAQVHAARPATVAAATSAEAS